MSEEGDESRNGARDGRRGSLRAALERALGVESQAVSRLAHARTSVGFRIEGAEEDVTLLLDRTPCEVVDSGEPAEVEICFTAEQAERFASGRLPLVAAVVTGAVDTSGPVRKYLEVDPILRALLDSGDPSAEREELGEPGHQEAEIDADLLAIETRDLTKSFGSHKILDGMNLVIPEGSISVVLGPSGTGKSVCLQHIIGLMKPDAGDVLIRGQALSEMSRSELLNLRRDIGVMFQDGALFSAMNIFENVAFPLRQHTDFNDAEVRELVETQLRSVGLGGDGDKMPGELSGGMRKRAGMARAMVLNPSIVLVDEPDSGLDPVRTSLLGDLIQERHAEQGGTILVVTHNILLARSIADYVAVIWQGKVLEAGMKEQILNSDTEFIQQFMSGSADGPLGMDA